jgi:hypothetical protein
LVLDIVFGEIFDVGHCGVFIGGRVVDTELVHGFGEDVDIGHRGVAGHVDNSVVNGFWFLRKWWFGE